MKNIKFLWLATIPIVFIGAWLDNVLVGSFTFKNYVIICGIEMVMFLTGVLIGRATKSRNA